MRTLETLIQQVYNSLHTHLRVYIYIYTYTYTHMSAHIHMYASPLFLDPEVSFQHHLTLENPKP